MDFATLLSRHLEARRMSYAAFAKKVGVKPPFLFALRKGERPVPAKRIEAWADALELNGRDRTEFVEEAWLTNAPSYVRELVERLRADSRR